jgi:hypothetical protein
LGREEGDGDGSNSLHVMCEWVQYTGEREGVKESRMRSDHRQRERGE